MKLEPRTLVLTTIVLLVLVGIPLGVVSAIYRNSFFDHLVRVVSVSGLAIASFWLGIMLMIVFSVRLRLFPVSGFGEGFW